MKVDSPGPVMQTLGEIEDAMAALQNNYTAAAGIRIELKHKLAVREQELYLTITDGTIPQRKALVAQKLAEDPLQIQAIAAESKLAQCKAEFEVLDSRRSIGQSLLKQFQHDSESGKYGKGSA